MFSVDGVARLEQTERRADPIAGLETVEVAYGEVIGIPPQVTEGDAVIVSSLVGEAWPSPVRPAGITVLVPDTGPTCLRDNSGQVRAVSRFTRK